MYTGDVASHEFVESALQRYARDAGGLDLLINNAGVAVAGLVEVDLGRGLALGSGHQPARRGATAVAPPFR